MNPEEQLRVMLENMRLASRSGAGIDQPGDQSLERAKELMAQQPSPISLLSPAEFRRRVERGEIVSDKA